MYSLEINNLVVDYGQIRALKGVNIKVPKGSIVALLGANGAGKSTLVRTISGVVKSKEGSIIVNGTNITNQLPHNITKAGIIQSPEGRLIFNGLTVEENLLVGAYSLKNKVIDGKKITKKETTKILLEEVYGYFPILSERKKQQASTLSGGEQQMLAIGRALMSGSEIILLDEPSLGLAPLIIQDIFNIIETIKNTGRTILIVEQNAFLTLKIADYAYVLELGNVKMEGKASELIENDELIAAYLGKQD